MVLVTPRNFCTVSITLAGSVLSSLPSKTRIWKTEKIKASIEPAWTPVAKGPRFLGQQPWLQTGAPHSGESVASPPLNGRCPRPSDPLSSEPSSQVPARLPDRGHPFLPSPQLPSRPLLRPTCYSPARVLQVFLNVSHDLALPTSPTRFSLHHHTPQTPSQGPTPGISGSP